MSAEIVNLRRARKAKARETAQATAAENRVLFGRTKAQRTAEATRDEQERRRLEGHRRDADARDGGEPPPDAAP
ncbi:DUF4169 family protein [Salinarimonas rosea]|uniref:DUF4169 family protein n=1 Tax=Salinarimonas rosea TaxID=552063 RepID=UPI0003FD7460|nr:DUF4169 family protein [Salinarimonas rosea]